MALVVTLDYRNNITYLLTYS